MIKTKFPQIYKNSNCERVGCKNKAVYIAMIGEADITCCEEHKKDAEKELTKNIIKI